LKKKIFLALALAIVMLVSLAGAALAADPVVSVDATSPGGGTLVVTATGVDTSTWNPGSVGQTNTFTALDSFTASYNAYSGPYGRLNTYVNAGTTTGGTFTMVDTQDFNILSANHNYNTVGTFVAGASGVTAGMNLKSIGSMYCWSEASNGGVGLYGESIGKSYDMLTNSVLTSTMLIQANATGGASISNSAAWGFGANENGTITTNYNGGTRLLMASGIGNYTQYVSSTTNLASSVALNADGTPVIINATMPGGAMSIIANFLNSFTANPYAVTAN